MGHAAFFSAWVESEANVHDQPSLDAEFAALCTQLEQEWLMIYQIEYSIQDKYCGRGEQPRFCKRPAAPPAGDGGASQPPFAVSLRWFASRASTIVTYCRDPDNCTKYKYAYAAARKMMATADRFVTVTSPFADLGQRQEWAELTKIVASLFLHGFDHTLFLFGWAPFDLWTPGGLDALRKRVHDAGQLADSVVKEAVATRGVKFGQWVREHAEGGAGALHKFTKPRTPWKPDGSVSFSGVDPSVATLQSVVDNEAKKWEALWQTRNEASAPDFSNHIANEPSLGRLTPAQIREAARHFKAATGVGVTTFTPGGSPTSAMLR